MIVLSILFFSVYGIVVLLISRGIDVLKNTELKNHANYEKFSILIPFRNEADNLPNVLSSLKVLNYPKNHFEIILINDHSTDSFQPIIDRFIANNPEINIRLTHLNNAFLSPKKEALKLGISTSNFNWIVSTDADCSVPENWLLFFNHCIQTKPSKFIAGPVQFTKKNSFLYRFQELSFMTLMGSTMAGFAYKRPILCNGANLCFNKRAYKEVSGYEGNRSIASGDDIFLLEKFRESFPEELHYLKNSGASVFTKANTTWTAFFQQQIRWASKTKHITDWVPKTFGILVFSVNLILLITFFFVLFGSAHPLFLLGLFVLKYIVDYVLLKKTFTFFKVKKELTSINMISSSLFYPLFTLVVTIGSFGKFYSWKGRQHAT